MTNSRLSVAPALLAISLALLATSSATLAQDQAQVPSLAPVIKKVSPAVVNIAIRGSIEVQRRNPFQDDPFFRRFFDFPAPGPQQRQFQSVGSGVIVDAENGYLLTNHHVIENADEITITLQDDRSLTARVVGSDPGTDIAVLQVEQNGLTEIPFGDSDMAEVGDWVIAIGNPFGLQHTVTSGIISALGRSGLNPEGYEDFIQTDASINPGNSGGALVSLRGELLGINSNILTRSGGNIGIGFAIPVNMAKAVMEQILEHGEVKRGLLGVNIYTITPDIAEAYGVEEGVQGALVSQVVPGSAAEKAGIKTGDIITEIEGRPIDNAAELRNAIGLLPVGERIKVTLLRDGRKRTVTATIGERADVRQVEAAEIHRGLEGAEFATAEADDGEGGVLVVTVQPGSPAWQRGLRPDDLITGVNRNPVSSLAEFRDAAEGASSLVLTLSRGGTTLLLPIR